MSAQAVPRSDWAGLGRFSSDPMWHPVSIYAVGDALFVHRRRAGVIVEVRRSTGGEVLLDEHVFGVIVTLQDNEGYAGKVILAPRTNAVAALKARGWLRGVPAGNTSFRCRARTNTDGRPAAAHLDVNADELRLGIGSRPPIVLRRANGAVVEGEHTMRRAFLKLADPYRTHAHIVVGRRDPLIRELRRTGWVD